MRLRFGSAMLLDNSLIAASLVTWRGLISENERLWKLPPGLSASNGRRDGGAEIAAENRL